MKKQLILNYKEICAGDNIIAYLSRIVYILVYSLMQSTRTQFYASFRNARR